ncbi:MAG TPA: response regulator [Candidatus Paceibacterota bacterium]
MTENTTTQAQAQPSPQTGEKKIVMIADDDAVFRTLISNKLSDAGFGVIEAEDGEQTLTLAKEKRPDLIILDIIMPKIGGVEVLEKLRASGEWGASIPVYMLTNMDDMKTIASTVQHQTAGYFVKTNYSIADIVKIISEYFKSHN